MSSRLYQLLDYFMGGRSMCIESMKAIEFNLTDLYAYEGWLKSRHPQNRHIKDKLRQQLQYLRDKGIVEFISRGQYRFIPPLKD